MSSAEAALRALAVVLAPYLPAASGPKPFSQEDGQRPPGAKRVKYLRAWRHARDAKDPGAWCEGRARLMTAECWAKWSRTEAPVTKAAAPISDPVLAALGGKRVGS